MPANEYPTVSTKAKKIGDRCVCGRCGQELEWTGTKWWDRGADTKCGPYKGRDGEIVREDYTKPHQPNFDEARKA